MARKLVSTKIQVFGGPGPGFRRTGFWGPGTQVGESVRLRPWDPGWGERAALEAEGRLNGGLGAKPPGIWGPYGPTWGPWLLSPLGGLLVSMHYF